MLVVGLSSLIGLFALIYKPLSENTKAMTTLGLKLQYLTEKLDREHDEHVKHIQDFEEYKSDMSEKQKQQWKKIDEHSIKIAEHETKLNNK